jgi:hypothetical protein
MKPLKKIQKTYDLINEKIFDKTHIFTYTYIDWYLRIPNFIRYEITDRLHFLDI